jgi:imidazolonepropionase-like amidohydrolase
MRTRFPALLLGLGLSAALGAAPPAERALAVTGVTVIDATGKPARPGQTVLIEGGRIAAIRDSAHIEVPADAEIVAGEGRFLIPGLADMHLHLANQPEPALTREWMLPMLLAHGITMVRDMGGDWTRIEELRRQLADGGIRGPRIVSPGPFVDGPGFVDEPVRTPQEARTRVGELAQLGVDFIKVQANLSGESYRAAVAEAKRRGLVIAGHVPVAVSAFEVARSGQRSIEHSSPILPGDAGLLLACSTREEELRAETAAIDRDAAAPDADRPALGLRTRELQIAMIESYDARRCARLAAILARRRIWWVPTQIWAQRLTPLDAADAIDPAVAALLPASRRARFVERRAAGIEQTPEEIFVLRRRIAEATRDLVATLHRRGVRLLAGSDALDGDVLPGLALHQELELMVRAGLTPSEALQTATRNAALYLGEAGARGTIEAGKVADLVLLDADPLADIANTRRIHAVIAGGRLISAAERQQLLDAAAVFASSH